MQTIPLTKGMEAMVDDDCYEELSKYKWCAKKNKRNYYAERSHWDGCRFVSIQMHRQIIGRPNGDGLFCDHINMNGLDNRRENLRLVTRSVNTHHARLRKDNTSGFYGIYLSRNRKKWVATIKVNNKRHHGGTFSCITDAIAARDSLARKHFGECAVLNMEVGNHGK